VISSGWLKKYNDASKLYNTRRAGACLKALVLINSVLGDKDNKEDLLAKFISSPFEMHYKCSNNNNTPYEMNLPIPLESLLGLLDLKCMCLVVLVEDLANQSHLDELLATAEMWLMTGSFAPPYADRVKAGTKGQIMEFNLCRIAQAYRLAGNFSNAISILEEVIKTCPDAMIILNTLMFSYREDCCYTSALKIADKLLAIALADNQGDYIRIAVTKATIAFEMGDYNLSIAMYNQIIDGYKINAPQINLYYWQTEARDKKYVDEKVLNEVLEYRIDYNNLDNILALAEIAFYSKRYDIAKQFINLILIDPRSYLKIRASLYNTASKISKFIDRQVRC
jgi:tetratricopeptide (TPR) repeat protein